MMCTTAGITSCEDESMLHWLERLAPAAGKSPAGAEQRIVQVVAKTGGSTAAGSMPIVVVASQKGGSGKTTIAAHLAVQAGRKGYKPAVLIDADWQGSLSRWWNARKDE